MRSWCARTVPRCCISIATSSTTVRGNAFRMLKEKGLAVRRPDCTFATPDHYYRRSATISLRSRLSSARVLAGIGSPSGVRSVSSRCSACRRRLRGRPPVRI
jgi:hypothetical protein